MKTRFHNRAGILRRYRRTRSLRNAKLDETQVQQRIEQVAAKRKVQSDRDLKQALTTGYIEHPPTHEPFVARRRA